VRDSAIQYRLKWHLERNNMRVARLTIKNYRGIKQAVILLPKHGVLIGDNNTGKTTVLEALDLVLGPDRLSRQPPIDEHDFFCGKYTAQRVSAQENWGHRKTGDRPRLIRQANKSPN
jgi:hypothetical protein